MSMVTYPLNNVEYTAEDAELFHVTRTSGVYANNSFDYSLSGADNTIVIGTGIAWIKNSEFSGKVVAQKEAVSLNMGLPDANYPRIDAIVIRFDANNNSTDIVVKQGTASSNPIAPVVTRTESIYELHLYHVQRNAGSLYVAASDITDLRTDDNYCGLMADSVTAIDAVPFVRKINGYTLEQDIDLTASDVGAVPASRTVNGKALNTNINLAASDVGAIAGSYTFIGRVTQSTSVEFNLTNHKGLLMVYQGYRNNANGTFYPTVPVHIPKHLLSYYTLDASIAFGGSHIGWWESVGAGGFCTFTETSATYKGKYESGSSFKGIDFWYYD